MELAVLDSDDDVIEVEDILVFNLVVTYQGEQSLVSTFSDLAIIKLEK